MNISLSTCVASETIADAPARPVTVSTVALTSNDGTCAPAFEESSAAEMTAAGTTSPRRVKRARSRSRAPASRLRTVPTGHARRCAASSCVCPSKSAQLHRQAVFLR